ncbi:MAG: hypothetical protein A2Z91_03985 [Deltaproteobacteria bacterium GWA2_38_16]|nr:MAG: hypothetical protein A2Z91_03985 [Deltaproteobacteria bacterium GWA2_38_16]OGQ01869.1 MAG: hypothetical protein A3D19_03110 [Deltaproteobacteria bacterium RIFCSPHIGHO2_02_FULL_38_15]OGQ30040.1 MAG: hypothetical protein A3A72_00155 [Deltaproteobacteria bacterium RIFCSPLOWO2_01_FULL_38_9]OGQ59383.1 MAG: hypothetical protein A3G92_00905 [Deltaproteobacteria bacterium RIFCSPLOWO2_12_FULL_38_8]HBQ20776.1 hypothetical protein [Deltaproteobacteria bacterium]
MTTTSGTVKSYDGTQIHYETIGEGLPLIFCYGVVCSTLQWKYQTQHLKKHYQVIHVDYRGHNQSQSPKNPSHLTIEGCAKDIEAVMNKLKLEHAILLGHSMGVNVIFQFYDLYPKKVSGLIAICGTIHNPFKTMFHTEFSQAGFEFLKLMYLKFPRQFPELWKKSIAHPFSQLLTHTIGFNYQLTQKKDIKNYLEGVSKQPIETFFYFLQEMNDFKGDHILKKIAVPTLIIGGGKDLITPIQNQYALYRKIKNAQFLKVPQGSHCAHMDMPELVNLRIEKFLKDINYA